MDVLLAGFDDLFLVGNGDGIFKSTWSTLPASTEVTHMWLEDDALSDLNVRESGRGVGLDLRQLTCRTTKIVEVGLGNGDGHPLHPGHRGDPSRSTSWRWGAWWRTCPGPAIRTSWSLAYFPTGALSVHFVMTRDLGLPLRI